MSERTILNGFNALVGAAERNQADRIRALEAERDALRSTLHTIATAPRPTIPQQARFCAMAQRIAREALGLPDREGEPTNG